MYQQEQPHLELTPLQGARLPKVCQSQIDFGAWPENAFGARPQIEFGACVTESSSPGPKTILGPGPKLTFGPGML